MNRQLHKSCFAIAFLCLIGTPLAFANASAHLLNAEGHEEVVETEFGSEVNCCRKERRCETTGCRRRSTICRPSQTPPRSILQVDIGRTERSRLNGSGTYLLT